tara:strand:+ start:4127 stop:4462 length:336 start_codon:yes stop_codon:yes gene_type:complete
MIAQIAIMILGSAAIWFVGRKEQWKRWGYILGLIGQPFWFYTAYTNEQWGILIMCLFYTYSWVQGIYNYWIKKPVSRISNEFDNQIHCTCEDIVNGKSTSGYCAKHHTTWI